MKIDFKGQEMTIRFDKVPNFLFFNEEGYGVGKLFLNGIQKKGLQDLKINAHTIEGNNRFPLKYRARIFNPETRDIQFLGNMKEELTLSVKLLDTKEFERVLCWIREIISDKRIPENIRNEYYESLKEFNNRFEKGE